MAKAPSLERIHARLNDSIQLTSIFCDATEIPFIIRACRLKPYDHMFRKYNYRFATPKWWFDEFSCSMEIIGKPGVPTFVYNDMRLDRDRIVCTDLYYGLDFTRLLKICKCFFFSIGRDEENKEYALLSFYGIDQYLRTFLYDDGWKQVSSLMLGRNALKFIEKNLDINGCKKMREYKIGPMLPCQKSESWLYCGIVSEQMKKTLNDEKYKLIKESLEI